jgi:uncharacterized protein (TIGR03437 family)
MFRNLTLVRSISLFTCLLLLPASWLTLTRSSAHMQTPPANDNLANPQPLDGASGQITGSNVGATKETGEPNHAGNQGGHSVWYRWKAPSKSNAVFSTEGSDFDTVLAVYTGDSYPLTEIVSNDDSGGRTSRVNFQAAADTIYLIAVDGYSGAAGNLILRWAPPTGLSIRGQCLDHRGRPAAGVDIRLSGDRDENIVSSNDGLFVFEGLVAGGNYTVSAGSNLDFGFLRSRIYNPLTSDVTDLVFYPTVPTFTIRGIVAANSRPVSNIELVLSGSGDIYRTTKTNSNGEYTLTGLIKSGYYNISPSDQSYRFYPESNSYSDINSDYINEDFTAEALLAISGRVIAGTSGLGDVQMTLSGAGNGTIMTNANGNYAFTGLAPGGTYQVTPSKTNFTFTPGSRSFSNLQANQVGVDFSAVLSTISIAATDASASEPGTDTATFTITRSGGNLATPLTVNYTIGGTAINGTDYDTITASVTIPANAASATVVIKPKDDTQVEGNETVVLTLSGNNNTYIIGSPNTATVTVADNDTLPTVSMTATDATASEPGTDTGTITVTRSGNTSAALTVNYSIGGTAVNGTDYETIPVSVTIPANAASTTIIIKPKDDTQIEGNETVVLTLANNSNYTIGSPNTATITISDNDTLPTVSITATDASAAEFGTDIGTITITRSGGNPAAALTVNYTIGGTAINGTDYDTITASVTIPANTTNTTVVIKPKDDTQIESNETVILTLASNSNYTIGSPNIATVTIADNDANPPSIRITAPVNGRSFTAPANITINAEASDNNGITRVEFFANNNRLGEDTSAPYSFQWNNVAVGQYSLTAKATDNQGAITTSASVNIKVVPPLAAISAASFTNKVAPESIVAVFGTDIAASSCPATTSPLPTSLCGVTVKLRNGAGTEYPAPLFFVSPTQINYQIPPGIVSGQATIAAMTSNGSTLSGTINLDLVAPGVFTVAANGGGLAAAVVLRVRANGTQSYEPVARFDRGLNRFVAVPIDLGPATDKVYLILYGTGWRFRSALAAVTVKVGGVDAPVSHAGKQGSLVGLDQINALLDRRLIGRGEVEVVLMVDGKTANTVRINIK